MLLSQFQRHGHTPIALVGGATAMIGDPSGKSQERSLLDEATIQRNLVGIGKQLTQFLDFDSGTNKAMLVNNADWIGAFSFIEFLRDVGKYFRVGEMMGKESVRKRLQSSAGMSFTEFSYQLLQGYDFLHLWRTHKCSLQIGGDDQWGNITAGIELTRKLDGQTVYGITSPLLTTAGGQKFGKTEAGTIWLDKDKTSPYEFYQYWMRVDDRDVIELLRRFTYLPMDQIAGLQEELQKQPEQRQAQKVLARNVTEMVHGAEGIAQAQKASEILFGGEIAGVTDKELAGIFNDVPSTSITPERLSQGIPLIDALCETKLCNSRGDAKKLIKTGGAYLNNKRISEPDYIVDQKSLATEKSIVLRSGKKNYHLIRIEACRSDIRL